MWWLVDLDDRKWLAYVIVRLQVSDYSQLSDYTVRLHCPITILQIN